MERKRQGYNPREIYQQNRELADAIDSLSAGEYSWGDGELFQPIIDSLLHSDDYLLLADYAAYMECSERAAAAWQDSESWTRMSILNCARCGFFSSDRSMQQYCSDLWNVKPLSLEPR